MGVISHCEEVLFSRWLGRLGVRGVLAVRNFRGSTKS
jgi:hypothetical protein